MKETDPCHQYNRHAANSGRARHFVKLFEDTRNYPVLCRENKMKLATKEARLSAAHVKLILLKRGFGYLSSPLPPHSYPLWTPWLQDNLQKNLSVETKSNRTLALTFVFHQNLKAFTRAPNFFFPCRKKYSRIGNKFCVACGFIAGSLTFQSLGTFSIYIISERVVFPETFMLEVRNVLVF